MSPWKLAVAVIGLSLGSLANAGTVYFSPNNLCGPPTNGCNVDTGSNTLSFTLNGAAITAYGFGDFANTPPSPVDLFQKYSGGSQANNESGLGLVNDVNGDHEIDPNSGIVLNLSNSKFAGASLSLYITSLAGDAFNWYHGSSFDPSQMFAGLQLGGTGDTTSPLSFTGGGTNSFIAIQGDSVTTDSWWFQTQSPGNVLLHSLSASTTTVPEPRYYGLLLTAMLGLAAMFARNRHRTE